MHFFHPLYTNKLPYSILAARAIYQLLNNEGRRRGFGGVADHAYLYLGKSRVNTPTVRNISGSVICTGLKAVIVDILYPCMYLVNRTAYILLTPNMAL